MPSSSRPQQPSATDPGFEERLKEGIAGMNNSKYQNPTVAAKVLNVRKPRSVSSCSIDHIVSRYHT